MKGTRRLLVAAMLWAGAARAQNPPQPPPAVPAQRTAPAPPAPHEGEPDEGLLEFLGSDDVGDAAWWDFLKKAPPRGNNPAAAPPDTRK